MNRGFTLIELIISIAIFSFMTVLVVAKYGNFNDSVLFTDTAYDVALAIHTAQNYGLSVRSAGSNFNVAYGMDFSTQEGGNGCGPSPSASNSTRIVLFADTNPNGVCTVADVNITTYTITRGATISNICSGTSEDSCTNRSRLSISFLRPNPEAIICGDGVCGQPYSRITLTSRDGSTRSISVRQTGQISVAAQ